MKNAAPYCWNSISHSEEKSPLHFPLSTVQKISINIVNEYEEIPWASKTHSARSIMKETKMTMKLFYPWGCQHTAFNLHKFSANRYSRRMKHHVSLIFTTLQCLWEHKVDILPSFSIKIRLSCWAVEGKTYITQSWHSLLGLLPRLLH